MAARVIVAMSGGVDSSVAAALLAREGFAVIGVTLNVWPRLAADEQREDACCSLAAVDDARRVCDRLGVPHYTLNFREVFERTVIADFAAEYARGRTPNPCLRCNEHVKFDELLRRALAMDADYIATGHYAVVRYDEARGRYLLGRGVDEGKDQSYALYTLTQDQLAHVLLPLGRLRKEQTREIAARLQLPVALKPDSQEICFVPDGDYAAFLRRHTGVEPVPGDFVDTSGRVLGRHRGLIHYTVGQRRGLGLATGAPLYVVALDPARNQVIVGAEADLMADWVVADAVNLIAEARLDRPLAVEARIRYRAALVAATAQVGSDGYLVVRFAAPQRAPAPGQAVVLYQDDLVVGGGTILRAGRGPLP